MEPIKHAYLNPLSVQSPIHTWFGGGYEQAPHCIGRIGDGWVIATRNTGLDQSFLDKIKKVHPYARVTGGDPDELDIEGPIAAGEWPRRTGLATMIMEVF